MKRINILLTALALIFATSCESFLDVKPSNQVDSGSSIQNVSDAKIMVQGLMNKLTSSNYYGRNFLIYGDAKGQTTITVSFAGNNKYAAAENKTITVNVELNDASVSVDNDTLDLKVDDKYAINANIQILCQTNKDFLKTPHFLLLLLL